MDLDFAPLSLSCYRALTDKLYDKRKMAATEIDKMARDFAQSGNMASLQQLLRLLMAMCQSPGTNLVKGGLIGMGAVAVSLGPVAAEPHCGAMIDVILPCFVRTMDARVRYYACESLYNVCKAVRGGVFSRFNAIWCAMAQLKVDVDANVRDGADVLDRLLLDLVVETSSFDVVSFMAHLRQRVYCDDRVLRQLSVTWLSHLLALTHVDVLGYVADCLDGLFLIVADSDESLSASCERLLQLLLDALVTQQQQQQQQQPYLSLLNSMVNVLVVHLSSSCARVQRVAMSWLLQFCQLPAASALLLPRLASLLLAVLPCLALDDESRRTTHQSAKTVNYQLLQLASREQLPGDQLPAVVDVLCRQLQRGDAAVAEQVAALKWLKHLQEVAGEALVGHVSQVFPVLLRTLSDPSDEVLRLDIQVLAEVCSSAPQETGDCCHLEAVMASLVRALENNAALLETRGAAIVRQLCVILSAEQIFATLALTLGQNDNVSFVARMVRQLNSILMTSAELFDVRTELQRPLPAPPPTLSPQPPSPLQPAKSDSASSGGGSSSDGAVDSSTSLFGRLYPVWCYSPVSTLALCLLTQRHRLALAVLHALGRLEVTVELLVELDALVQLLETPVFCRLRLQLLEPWRCPLLLDTLHGVLMLLPQSEAFQTLRRRLDCVPYHRMIRSGVALGSGAPAALATPASDYSTVSPAGSPQDPQRSEHEDCEETQRLISVFWQACSRYRQHRRSTLAATINSSSPTN